MKAQSGKRRRRVRALAGWTALLVLAGAWWWWLAPHEIGGRATYVLVHGVSMEPMLHTGDLAIAWSQPQYQVGDLVVYPVLDGGRVIHRIVDGSESAGWITQGDNNSWRDPWVVRNEDIMGRYQMGMAGAGEIPVWLRSRPLAFGALAGLVTLLLYAPVRLRRLHPALRQALASAVREPRRDGRSQAEYGILWLSGAATVVSASFVVLALAARAVTWATWVTAAALLVAGGFFGWFLYRLYDGVGKFEPAKSLYALAGRLHRVEELPELDADPEPVRSAIALRAVAEKYRLPVLHAVDPNTGQHAFLLITVQEGSYLWLPLVGRHRVPGDAEAYASVRRPRRPAGSHRAAIPAGASAGLRGGLRARPALGAMVALLAFLVGYGAASNLAVFGASGVSVFTGYVTSACSLGTVTVVGWDLPAPAPEPLPGAGAALTLEIPAGLTVTATQAVGPGCSPADRLYLYCADNSRNYYAALPVSAFSSSNLTHTALVSTTGVALDAAGQVSTVHVDSATHPADPSQATNLTTAEAVTCTPAATGWLITSSPLGVLTNFGAE